MNIPTLGFMCETRMNKEVYLDYQATTPVDPKVMEAMMPYFSEKYGNATSTHHFFGRVAEKGINTAREEIASLINAKPHEIIFTSGATESINLALKGVAEAKIMHGNHIITVKTEHPAILSTCRNLEKTGFEVTYLDVESDGLLDVNLLEQSITEKTILISVMHANNEIGVIQPVQEIGKLCKDKCITFFVDGAQSFGKIPVNLHNLNIDLFAMSAHKIYGPKGVGALFIRNATSVIPQQDGGGQEDGFRSGTLNTPGIVGFGKAVELAGRNIPLEQNRIRKHRNNLLKELNSSVVGLSVNGSMEQRLAENLNISIKGMSIDFLMRKLDRAGIAVSTGSACSSGSLEPSHVLKALGLNDYLATTSIRFSLGRFTAKEDITITCKKFTAIVNQFKEMN